MFLAVPPIETLTPLTRPLGGVVLGSTLVAPSSTEVPATLGEKSGFCMMERLTATGP